METDNTKTAFGHIKECAWDPIVEILEMYRNCDDPNKINLTIGAYRDENLQPIVFRCVKKAEEKIFNEELDRKYLPSTGDEEFNKLTQRTIFKEGHDIYSKEKILTVQSLSGSGCLRVGGTFCKKFISDTILVPHLTWPNHGPIFEMSGMNVKDYRFYDEVTNGISMKNLLEDLENAEEGSVVLLHVCGNNPTGVDPNKEEWKKIADVMKKRNLFPFFDMAYQGFISGDIEEDSFPIYLFYNLNFEMLIAVSYSKNMGLYGERAGPLHIITNDPSVKENIKSQLSSIIEGLYLTPVSHGSRIIKTVLKDQKLREDWLKELKEIVNRLNYVRLRLYETLIKIKAPGSWEHIKDQNGMFSYTGLTKKQCEALIEKHKVFLVKSGRISLSGINDDNVEVIAKAIKDVKENY